MAAMPMTTADGKQRREPAVPLPPAGPGRGPALRGAAMKSGRRPADRVLAPVAPRMALITVRTIVDIAFHALMVAVGLSLDVTTRADKDGIVG